MPVTIDARGRVTLPPDVRAVAHFEPGDAVDVVADGVGCVTLLSIEPMCAVCGDRRGLLAEFGADPVRRICVTCADAVAAHPLVFQP